MIETTVVIPLYHAEKYLERLLSSLFAQQTTQPYEVILIDSSRFDDGSEVIVRKYMALQSDVPVTYLKIDNAEFQSGGTRNRGADMGTGAYILFATHDVEFTDNRLIEKLVTLHKADPQIGLIYTQQIPYADADLIEQHNRYFNYPPHDILKTLASYQTLGIKAYHNSTVSNMVKREAFNKAGQFPTDVDFIEDIGLGQRMLENGYSILYTAQTSVRHSHNYSLKQEFTRMRLFGASYGIHANLRAHGSAEKEGLRFVASYIKYIFAQRANPFYWLPAFVIYAAVKWAGYRIGFYNGKQSLKSGKAIDNHSTPEKPGYWY